MNIVKKIFAEVTPDTQQRTYLAAKEVELNIDVLKFKDGTIRVSILNTEQINNHRFLKVKAYVENLDDIIICAQIKDIVSRLKPELSTMLQITSPIYSRYDRVMLGDKNDSFAAKVFSNFVDACYFDFVGYVDCHSNVLRDLTNNGYDIEQQTCYDEVLDVKQFNTIAPDKGALKKCKVANLVFDKKRDLATGKILGIELISSSYVDLSKEFLVVDDLCEGGGTFLGLAEGFNLQYPNSKINLYVTHGLFTNNAIDKLLDKYSKIYVYIMKKSVYDSISEVNKQRVVVNTLITD